MSSTTAGARMWSNFWNLPKSREKLRSIVEELGRGTSFTMDSQIFTDEFDFEAKKFRGWAIKDKTGNYRMKVTNCERRRILREYIRVH